MVVDSSLLFWIGYIIMAGYIFAIYLKIHRNKNVVPILFLLGIFVAITGYFIVENYTDVSEKPIVASTFYSPIIYISLYQLFRTLFKKRFGREPTYEYASSIDLEDNIKLTVLDYTVFVLPMAIALIIPIFFF